MSKSMVAVITAVITAVVSVCSTLVVVKYTGEDGTEKEVRAEIQYEEDGGDDAEFESYELSGGQQTVEGENVYNFNIKAARFTQNSIGEPAVVITFGFTNVSDESKSLWDACMYEYPMVYQEGVELEHTTVSGVDWDSLTSGIKPGVSFDVELAFLLNNTTSDIEAEIGIQYRDTNVSRTFTLS